jgi:integrase
VRNVGIKNLYRRGKVYYYVAHGKWTSLGTRDRSEARRQVAKLQEQQVALKFLKKSGLLEILQKQAQYDSKPPGGQAGSKALAPSFAKADLPDFAQFTSEFVARIPCPSKESRRMWRTCGNTLTALLETLEEFDSQDLRSLNAWQKLEKLSPSGAWNALQKQAKGPATLNHFASFLRILVPHLVERGFAPSWFAGNLKGIKRLKVHARTPFIPSPAEMETLLSKCEERDWELGQLLRFLAFSGARRGAALDSKTGLIWSRVDFTNGDITLWMKGDQKRTVPMGPQLRQLLWGWKEYTGGSDEARIFPFGSTREDQAQRILKDVASGLGGPLKDMNHFHAFRHYWKTQHQRQGTADHISDLLSFNAPAGRRGSGDVYRHDAYAVMRQCVER